MYTRLLVKNILEHPQQFKWSIQGLGMMRIYLDEQVRLHIWDSALRIPGVSPVHTHPWDLHSMVVAGVYRQYRYSTGGGLNCAGLRAYDYNVATIKCGEDAAVTEETKPIQLWEHPLEIYKPEEHYSQSSVEIHRSCPDDSTVTIVTRTFKADREHAQVFWQGRGGWVDAAPRPATSIEVEDVCTRALNTWF